MQKTNLSHLGLGESQSALIMYPLGVKKIGCYVETLKEQSLRLNPCR